MNEIQQKRFDHALITMPLCFASSAYHNNPYYYNRSTLVIWARRQVMLFLCGDPADDCLLTNTVDCKAVQDWLNMLDSAGGD